ADGQTLRSDDAAAERLFGNPAAGGSAGPATAALERRGSRAAGPLLRGACPQCLAEIQGAPAVAAALGPRAMRGPAGRARQRLLPGGARGGAPPEGAGG